MRSVSIMQPVFMPWIGYFEQLAVTDEFVFMDDAQYTAQDWRNRNRIKTSAGPIWLTVPVRDNPLSARIMDIEIDWRRDWRRKHIESIRQSYGKAPHFQDVFPMVQSWYESATARLADFTMEGVRLFADYLGIVTPMSTSAVIARAADTDRLGRLVEIARARDGDAIYLGASARDYVDVDYMGRNGIAVVFQDYRHPEYPQRYPPFASHMAVIDLVMNCGRDSLGIILSSPRPAALRRARR